jgi:hypothetical protein
MEKNKKIYFVCLPFSIVLGMCPIFFQSFYQIYREKYGIENV